ncbi:MAG TPA: GNAT family protein [Thermoleophilaceae bacterium]|jgi:RimJ/RimL family protein N-acetyltransferase|nr:GNAT family protein [Thermoleophilaceae bacterium]
MRIDGDGFALVPEHPRYAREWARAFREDPHLAVDWGIEETMSDELAEIWLREHAALWEEGEGRHFAVVAAGGDAFFGGVNFHNIRPDHRRAEVGFWLAPWARRRGIGSAAVAAACRWAFERWQLVRIEMTTLPDNEASLALAAKVGFKREGLLRQRNYERGKQVDIVMLGLVAGEPAVSAEPTS